MVKGARIRNHPNRAEPYPGACGHQAAGNFAHDNAHITDQPKALIIINLSGDTPMPRNSAGIVFFRSSRITEVIMNTRVTIEVSPAGAARIISTERVDGQSAAANVETAERVKLDPKAADFEARRAELKASGYKWNGKTETWVRPANGSATSAASQPDLTGWYGDATEITLSKDDVHFEAKKAVLKEAGFKWDGTRKIWAKA